MTQNYTRYRLEMRKKLCRSSPHINNNYSSRTTKGTTRNLTGLIQEVANTDQNGIKQLV
jgi:hypothetical protein